MRKSCAVLRCAVLCCAVLSGRRVLCCAGAGVGAVIEEGREGGGAGVGAAMEGGTEGGGCN